MQPPLDGTMKPDIYPSGTIRRLLATDLVTPQTRAVLLARLDAPPATGLRFFDEAEFTILRAAAARLIPQPDRPVPIDLAGAIDDRLASGAGKGWRYASMPPDGEAYRRGLQGLDDCARELFGVAFTSLDGAGQDAVLRAVQHGELSGGVWDALPPRRFFEELLAELAESYYSHPLAQEEIGYVGFADARGWQAVGLDTLAQHEPRAVTPAVTSAAADAEPG